MAYNFKSIADVEVVAEPAEFANVLIEENGVIKKAPKTAVGGGNTEWDAIIEYCNTNDEFYMNVLSGDYQTIYNKIIVEHEVPKVKVLATQDYYGLYTTISQAYVGYNAHDDYIRIVFKGSLAYPGDFQGLCWYPDNSLE
jgi:hypothetical protein